MQYATRSMRGKRQRPVWCRGIFGELPFIWFVLTRYSLSLRMECDPQRIERERERGQRSAQSLTSRFDESLFERPESEKERSLMLPRDRSQQAHLLGSKK